MFNLQIVECWPTVYPCAYREHKKYIMNFVFFYGLSLCIQGTLIVDKNNHGTTRFIPVHTGNMYVSGSKNDIFTVYPCAYREHIHP